MSTTKNTMMKKKIMKLEQIINNKMTLIKFKRRNKLLSQVVRRVEILSTMEKSYLLASMRKKITDHLELKEVYKDHERLFDILLTPLYNS